jgi:hypothetical protein
VAEPEPVPTPVRPNWRRRVAIAAGLVVLGFGAAEVALRRLAPRDPPLWTEHPLCFLVRTPGLEVKARGWDGKTFVDVTNPLGFRGRNVKTLERPKDAFRVVTLGDELTEGGDLPEEQTWTGLVESQLEARRSVDDPRIEAANAAGPCFGIEAVYATLVHRVLAAQPDLVVVQTAQNDVRCSLSETWDPTGLGWRVPDVETPGAIEWLCDVSRAAHAVRGRMILLGLARPLASTPRPFARLRPKPQGVEWTRTLPTYARYLHLIAAACRDAKADLVLCTQPTLIEDNNSPEEKRVMAPFGLEGGPGWSFAEVQKALAAYDEEVRTAAAREGCHLVDLAKTPRDLDHFSGTFHLTPRGHASVAKAVVDVAFPENRPARALPRK